MAKTQETKKPRVALVLGSARCLNDDVEAALELFEPSYVIASKNAARAYSGPVDEVVDKCRVNRGAFMTWTALKHHADKVVFAGMPETVEGGHVTGDPHRCAPYRQRFWTLKGPVVGDRIRSMSGWTREFFGAPTPEWLAESAGPADVFDNFGNWVEPVLVEACALVDAEVRVERLEWEPVVFVTAPGVDISVGIHEYVFARPGGKMRVSSVTPFRLRLHMRDVAPNVHRLAESVVAELSAGPLTLERWSDGRLRLRAAA